MDSKSNNCSKNEESGFSCKLKMRVTIMMQFYVTSVKHGSTSNVITSTILTTNIYQVVMSHRIASPVPIHSFHLVIWTIRIFSPSLVMIILSVMKQKLNSSLLLKLPPDLALLFNQFNNAIPENRSDTENVIQSKYYEIDELQQLQFP